ncbi:hypothetical protein Hanom_Chr14g01250171 [Helianthus anomalus]
MTWFATVETDVSFPSTFFLCMPSLPVEVTVACSPKMAFSWMLFVIVPADRLCDWRSNSFIGFVRVEFLIRITIGCGFLSFGKWSFDKNIIVLIDTRARFEVVSMLTTYSRILVYRHINFNSFNDRRYGIRYSLSYYIFYSTFIQRIFITSLNFLITCYFL